MENLEEKEDEIFLFDDLNTKTDESLEALGVSLNDMLYYMNWFKTYSNNKKISKAELFHSMWKNALKNQEFAKCLIINAHLGSSISETNIDCRIKSSAAITIDKFPVDADKCKYGYVYGTDCGSYRICLEKCIECKDCDNHINCNNCNYLSRVELKEQKGSVQ